MKLSVALSGAVAAALLFACASTPQDPGLMPADEPTGHEAIAQAWTRAVEASDGEAACPHATKKLQTYFIAQATGWKLVEGKPSCAEAFTAFYEREHELTSGLELEELVPITATKKRASYEMHWTHSEEGDGAGLELVKKGDSWLVSRG